MRKYLISLLEPVQCIKSRYKDYVLHAVQNNLRQTFPNQSWELAHGTYLQPLLPETSTRDAQRLESISKDSPAVSYLMQCGVDRDNASRMSSETYQDVIDALLLAVPDLIFGDEDSFQYGLCDVYDILVFDMRKH